MPYIVEQLRAVLSAWPEDCQPLGFSESNAESPGFNPPGFKSLGGAGGFSGAELWRLTTTRGKLCLRRWPPESPDPQRLGWIHAVLEHVAGQGINFLPVPIATRSSGQFIQASCDSAVSGDVAVSGQTYVEHNRHLWELSPWMPGRADYHDDPRLEKLLAAMRALAEFHLAAATFSDHQVEALAQFSLTARTSLPLSGEVEIITPLRPVMSGANDLHGIPNLRPSLDISVPSPQPLASSPRLPSPGIQQRLAQVDRLLAGDFEQLHAAAGKSTWPAFVRLATQISQIVRPRLEPLRRQLTEVSNLIVPLQPCLRDVWHDHVLFEGDVVTGIVDFGAMRMESPAGDVARLLTSLCAQDHARKYAGRSAYETVRPLSATEKRLFDSFTESTSLLSGLNWVEWVAIDGRRFSDPAAVLQRMEEIVAGLMP